MGSIQRHGLLKMTTTKQDGGNKFKYTEMYSHNHIKVITALKDYNSPI